MEKIQKDPKILDLWLSNTLKATKESEGSHRIEGAHAAKTLSRVNEDDLSVVSPGVLYIYIYLLFIVNLLNIQKVTRSVYSSEEEDGGAGGGVTISEGADFNCGLSLAGMRLDDRFVAAGGSEVSFCTVKYAPPNTAAPNNNVTNKPMPGPPSATSKSSPRTVASSTLPTRTVVGRLYLPSVNVFDSGRLP